MEQKLGALNRLDKGESVSAESRQKYNSRLEEKAHVNWVLSEFAQKHLKKGKVRKKVNLMR